MKIILSPAKKMKEDLDSPFKTDLPKFLEQAEEIRDWLKSQSHEELKQLWKCNDKIAEQNFQRLADMDLRSRLSPAILTYEGIAYQYMAPAVFENTHFAYIQDHLRILSAFYGVLRPMDGVRPYRLEMQAKASIPTRDGSTWKNLYDLWGPRLYQEVRDASGIIINLASKEYAKSIEKYLTPADRCITITFCEESKGKLVTKGTYAKMARGDMVRYMAENQIENPEDLKKYDRLGYRFREEYSSPEEFVFER